MSSSTTTSESTLLSLPAELRLMIFSHLPDLRPGLEETVGPNVRLTPAISRTSQLLRRETLPIYAQTCTFLIHIQDGDADTNSNALSNVPNSRLKAWLSALGTNALSRVRSLQLSDHWRLARPFAWQGHVGFYVKLQFIGGTTTGWKCTAGTYPIVNDRRGWRAESVALLLAVVWHRMITAKGGDSSSGEGGGERRGLTREDVEAAVRAMQVIARHPIEGEETEMGRQRGLQVWTEMERELLAVSGIKPNQGDAGSEGEASQAQGSD